MIILWGFRNKLLKPVYMGIRYCRHCGKFQHFYLMRSVQQFTLFFVPIFWWTKEYYVGCGTCSMAKKISKQEYTALHEEYQTFLSVEQTKDVFEFCVDMAKNRENIPENIEKLFNQVKERFDLRGFDEDFKKMIMNIFAVQEAARNQPRIVD